MPGPYSNDLRECVISARADGRSCREVARLFNVSVSSVAGRSRRHKRTGSIRPDRIGRIHGSVPDGCRDWIPAGVRACPQTAVRRLQALLAERGTPARSAVSRLRLQEENARRGRARPSGRGAPPRTVEAPSGPGGSAQAGLHRRDLRQDRHGPAPGMGAQRRKAAGQGPRALENLDLHRHPAP